MASLTVAGLRLLFSRLRLSPLAADVLALGFGYGSLLWPYATTFNNHAVAAGLLMLSFLLVMERGPTRAAGLDWRGVGFLRD